jgi:hypothetical protein
MSQIFSKVFLLFLVKHNAPVAISKIKKQSIEIIPVIATLKTNMRYPT